MAWQKKKNIKKLNLGDIITVKVVDRLQADQFIISIAGDLLTVKLEGVDEIKVGDMVTLRVTKTTPLEFKIFKMSPLGPGSFNRFA